MPKPSVTLVVTVALVCGAAVVAWRATLTGRGSADPVVPVSVRIALDDPGFGRSLRRPVAAVLVGTAGPVAPPRRCRWVYQHTDVGFELKSDNGCAGEFFVDPARTRTVRFELDPWMAVDVIVSERGQRVGFASSAIRYVDQDVNRDAD